MRKIILLLCSILPFAIGFGVAYFQGRLVNQTTVAINTSNIPATDVITISNGDIYKLTKNNTTQITHNQNLIEPVVVGTHIAAVEKTTNYSSLLMYDSSGNGVKTLFNGNSNAIDTMSWITDPSVNLSQDRIAYVSDKDKALTNVPDNALYVLNLSTGKSTNIAKPEPYSGGIAHPIFDPVNNNIILYDYYQYNPQTLIPYATIEQYDNTTSLVTTLTSENRNAYQAAFSPDGKQLLFLGRNNDASVATLYVADFSSTTGLSNIHALFTGDIAYPAFSYAKGHIYYLYSERNKGYNLLTASIENNRLIKISTVVDGFRLLGNSSYSVSKL